MLIYIGSNTSDLIPSSTLFPQNSTIFTMILSNITPGNTLLVTPNCPISNNVTNPLASITLTVSVGSGTPQSIISYGQQWGNMNVFVPPLVFTVQSNPAGTSTQTLTVSAVSSAATLVSPPVPVNFTCTVLEVS